MQPIPVMPTGTGGEGARRIQVFSAPSVAQKRAPLCRHGRATVSLDEGVMLRRRSTGSQSRRSPGARAAGTPAGSARPCMLAVSAGPGQDRRPAVEDVPGDRHHRPILRDARGNVPRAVVGMQPSPGRTRSDSRSSAARDLQVDCATATSPSTSGIRALHLSAWDRHRSASIRDRIAASGKNSIGLLPYLLDRGAEDRAAEKRGPASGSQVHEAIVRPVELIELRGSCANNVPTLSTCTLDPHLEHVGRGPRIADIGLLGLGEHPPDRVGRARFHARTGCRSDARHDVGRTHREGGGGGPRR